MLGKLALTRKLVNAYMAGRILRETDMKDRALRSFDR